jgi:small conductance mechanosensitive channel
MHSSLIPDWLKVIYAEWGPGIRIVLAILLALLARAILQFMIRRIVKSVSRSVRKNGEDSPLAEARLLQRTKTIGSVLSNLATWGLTFTVFSIALTEAGVSPGAIVAGAGILGAGLGFGAQSLIKDLISGLFIVFEDQYGVGDTVDLGQASGVIESVGLRVTQLRDIEGTVWFVRNGEILRVGNQSQGWSRVVLDVPLAYGTNIDKAQQIMTQVANETAKKNAKLVIGEPEVWGINLLSGDQVVIRVVQKTKPETKDLLARTLRANLKTAFDKNRIKLAQGSNSIYLNVTNK